MTSHESAFAAPEFRMGKNVLFLIVFEYVESIRGGSSNDACTETLSVSDIEAEAV